jgi:aminoglycoside 6'-N-acetyltransferase I
MPSVHIEALVSADDSDWLALRMALWPDGEAREHRDEMAGFLEAPSRFAQFIARTDDGRAIGLVEASVRGDYVNGTESSPVGFVEGVFVAPAWRRKGVARQLYAAIGDWARARGCHELASDALLENIDSQRAHRALGFRETERVVYFTKKL